MLDVRRRRRNESLEGREQLGSILALTVGQNLKTAPKLQTISLRNLDKRSENLLSLLRNLVFVCHLKHYFAAELRGERIYETVGQLCTLDTLEQSVSDQSQDLFAFFGNFINV